jgi:hypothetical protein
MVKKLFVISHVLGAILGVVAILVSGDAVNAAPVIPPNDAIRLDQNTYVIKKPFCELGKQFLLTYMVTNGNVVSSSVVQVIEDGYYPANPSQPMPCKYS